MITLFLVLCLHTTPHDECSLYTRQDVIPVAVAMNCFLSRAWATLIETEPEVREKVRPGHYLRIFCSQDEPQQH